MTNKMTPTPVLDDLIAALGAGNVLSAAADLSRYCRDWTGDYQGRTLAVQRPRTTQEVSDAVRACRDLGLAIIPQGGHTGLVNGALPDDPQRHVVISLERLNAIRQIDPVNFSMVVESGCVLESVKEAAEARDCTFPLSLGAQGSCQIGGNVATNAGGINVLRYGMMRELVLGLEVVLPDGRIWDGMSALRKDNRGIDLKQLFIGSEGILGIVTAVTLKLFPKPQKVETAFLGLNSVTDAITLYNRARRDCADLLTAFELIPADCLSLAREAVDDLQNPLDTSCPVYLLIEVSASGLIDLRALFEQFLENVFADELVIDGTLAASQSQAQNLWTIREAMVEGQVLHGHHLRTDISVAIPDLAPFVDEALARTKDKRPDSLPIAYGHVGDGNIHLNVLAPDDLSDADKKVYLRPLYALLMDLVDKYNGSISAEHGIGRTKRDAFLQRISPEHRDILGGMKTALDPDNLMNPGCILDADGGGSGNR